MLERFFDVIVNNPAGSICIFLAGILLLCSGLRKIEFGPLEFSVENSSRKSMRNLGLLLLAMGLIFVADFSFASIFQKTDPPVFDGIEEEKITQELHRATPIEKLHKAAEAWDVTTATEAIQELEATDEECNQRLAENVKSLLDSQGESGLNYLNLIQESITAQAPECRYPKLEHADQY